MATSDSGTCGLIGFSFNIPEPIEEFVGRTEQLNSLHNFSLEQSAASEINTFAPLTTIIGTSGVGKTILAAHYVNKYFRQFYDNAVWINGDSRSSISNSFQQLCETLRKDPDTKDPIKLLQQIYGELSGTRTIFVFDNVNDYGDLKGFIPRTISNFTKPFVLVTSTSAPESTFPANQIELECFSKKEAVKLIQTCLNLSTDTELLCGLKISEALFNFPLAVQLGLSFIKARMYSKKRSSSLLKELKAYEQLIQATQLKLYSADVRLESYQNAVSTVCKITLRKLKKLDTRAKRILEILSYLDPQAIALNLLTPLNSDTVKRDGVIGAMLRDGRAVNVEKTIGLLSDWGLIRRNIFEDSLSIHPKVQLVIRANMEKKYRYGAFKDATYLIQTALKSSNGKQIYAAHGTHLVTCIKSSQLLNLGFCRDILKTMETTLPTSVEITGIEMFRELVDVGKYDEALGLVRKSFDETVFHSNSSFKFEFTNCIVGEIQNMLERVSRSGHVNFETSLVRLCDIGQVVVSEVELLPDDPILHHFQKQSDFLWSSCQTEPLLPIREALARTSYEFYNTLLRAEKLKTRERRGFKTLCALCSNISKCLFIAKSYGEVYRLLDILEIIGSQFREADEMETDSLIAYVCFLDEVSNSTKVALCTIMEKKQILLALHTQNQIIFEKYKAKYNFLAALSVGRGILDCFVQLGLETNVVDVVKELRTVFQKLSENCNIVASSELEARLTQIPDWICSYAATLVNQELRAWLMQQGFQIYRKTSNIAVGNAEQLFAITKRILTCAIDLEDAEVTNAAANKFKSWLGCQGPTLTLACILPVFVQFFAHSHQLLGGIITRAFSKDLEQIVRERFGRYSLETLRQMAYISEILKLNSVDTRTSGIQSQELIRETLALSQRWHEIAAEVRADDSRVAITFLHNLTVSEFLLWKDETILLQRASTIHSNVISNVKVATLLILCKLSIELSHLGYENIALEYLECLRNKTGLIREIRASDDEARVIESIRQLAEVRLSGRDVTDDVAGFLEKQILETILI